MCGARAPCMGCALHRALDTGVFSLKTPYHSWPNVVKQNLCFITASEPALGKRSVWFLLLMKPIQIEESPWVKWGYLEGSEGVANALWRPTNGCLQSGGFRFLFAHGEGSLGRPSPVMVLPYGVGKMGRCWWWWQSWWACGRKRWFKRGEKELRVLCLYPGVGHIPLSVASKALSMWEYWLVWFLTESVVQQSRTWDVPQSWGSRRREAGEGSSRQGSCHFITQDADCFSEL